MGPRTCTFNTPIPYTGVPYIGSFTVPYTAAPRTEVPYQRIPEIHFIHPYLDTGVPYIGPPGVPYTGSPMYSTVETQNDCQNPQFHLFSGVLRGGSVSMTWCSSGSQRRYLNKHCCQIRSMLSQSCQTGSNSDNTKSNINGTNKPSLC